MKPTLRTLTLGCSKNQVDTEHLLAAVQDKYDILPENSSGRVDFLVVNTCGFIGDAKEESVNAIMQAVDLKNRGEIGHLFVMGCLSQRYMDQLPGLIPEVDRWFGARDIRPVAAALGSGQDPDLGHAGRYIPSDGASYAYLKISEGCDRRCSYCAIPFIRGAHRSVPIESLVKEARFLASKGVRELVLIAQDTTYYGLDLYRRRALAELLDRLSEIDGIEWIRIHYSYPQDFPEDVLDRMANNPKVCRYMDIPLQHVADKVLDNMHRHVDGAWTRALIRKMREKVPGIVLRTTMIVGHPGEGTREFRELLDFVSEARFERLGAFTYSEEEGTFGAENFRDSVRKSTKEKRLSELMTLQRDISLSYNTSRVGQKVKVLVDAFSGENLVCRSEFESPEVDGEILVVYDPLMGASPEQLVGHFMEVEIVRAMDYDLEARFVRMSEPVGNTLQ